MQQLQGNVVEILQVPLDAVLPLISVLVGFIIAVDKRPDFLKCNCEKPREMQ